MNMVKLQWPFRKRATLEAAHGTGYKVEEETGKVSTEYHWQNRLPHPINMDRYEEWGNDAEASVALNVLANIIAGVGYYTEMDEEHQPSSPDDKPHAHKTTIDEYGESVNLDEKLQYITHTMLHKGFCPVEVIDDYDLKILPPESFYIHMNKTGKLLKYTQERSVNDVLATWKTQAEMDTILLFFFGWTPSRAYGKSLLEPIGDLIDERAQMNVDMPAAIHRWAYPIPIMETSGSKDSLQKVCEERDIDEWIFIGNANEGEVRWNTLAIDPQARFIPYIELIYYQICEGLHAPLLLYLKNATEASATVMMESVDRLVNGVQRYLKRRVEKHLFEPQTGKPVPRVVWGQPKTGLEEIELDQVANLYASGAVKFNQVQDLLKQLGMKLIEPEEDPFPPQTQIPFGGDTFADKQKPVQAAPTQAMLEKLGDLTTTLNIIETNYHEKRLPLTKAMKLGGKAIEVYLKRMHGAGSEYESKRQAEFGLWAKRLIGAVQGKQTYRVSVD